MKQENDKLKFDLRVQKDALAMETAAKNVFDILCRVYRLNSLKNDGCAPNFKPHTWKC